MAKALFSGSRGHLCSNDSFVSVCLSKTRCNYSITKFCYSSNARICVYFCGSTSVLLDDNH